jgi:hypothetical protein
MGGENSFFGFIFSLPHFVFLIILYVWYKNIIMFELKEKKLYLYEQKF